MSNTRQVAAAGRIVSIQTVIDELDPGSDVANMGLLGYNPREAYTGRAPIEAAGAGIAMGLEDVAFRCNLVTAQDGVMSDHSAGHISTAEGHELLAAIQAELGREGVQFYPGVSYRHLLIWNRGPESATTAAPHDHLDEPIAACLPSGDGAEAIRSLMDQSREILEAHPVNRHRIDEGKHPATQIWLWGQGRPLELVPFPKRYGLTGGIVTAVDLVRGLGVLAGLETPKVEGATGFLDTNYAGKVAAAQDILERNDFVYVHVEAPDECGHLGDPVKKTQACADFDQRVVGPMWNWLEARGESYRLMITMDHRTPCALRKHSREPVPLALLEGPVQGGRDGQETLFDESVIGEPEAFSFDLVRGLLDN